MAEFTLLEIHLDDASFTANAPLNGRQADSATGTGSELGADEAGGGGGSGPNPLPFVLVLVALVVLGAVLRRLIGGADEEITAGESPPGEA